MEMNATEHQNAVCLASYNWLHGSCEIPWEFIIYHPYGEEKDVCEFAKKSGWCYGPNDGLYSLSEAGQELVRRYRKEYADQLDSRYRRPF